MSNENNRKHFSYINVYIRVKIKKTNTRPEIVEFRQSVSAESIFVKKNEIKKKTFE